METTPYRLEIDTRHEPFRDGKPQRRVTQGQLDGCLKLGKIRKVMLEGLHVLKS